MPRCKLIAAIATAALWVTPAADAATFNPGEPDPTFNGGQPLVLDLAKSSPKSTGLADVFVDGAGRPIAGGNTVDQTGNTAIALVRLTPAGALDSSFGTGGSSIVTGPGTHPSVLADSVFPAPGGGIGAGVFGAGSDGRNQLEVARFLGNGSTNLDFGAGGFGTAQPAGPAPAYSNTSAAAVDGTTGAMFASGVIEANPTTGANRKLVLTKFTPGGSLDTSGGFGTGGSFIGSFSQYPGNSGTYGGPMVVLGNGKILMAGTTTGSDSRQAVFIARFTAAGQPESTFGKTGPGYTVVQARDPGPGASDSQASDLALGSDGSIYVAGRADDAFDRFAFSVTKFGVGGQVDTSFGLNGTKRIQTAQGTDPDSNAQAVALQADDKVVLVGTSAADLQHATLTIVRLLPDGALDPSFGDQGVVQRQFAAVGAPRQRTFGSGATIGPDGNLVVAGSVAATTSQGFVARFLLSPYTPPPPPPGGSPGPGPGPGPGAGKPKAGAARVRTRRLTVLGGRVRIPLACSAAGACDGNLLVVEASGKVAAPAARRRPRQALTYARAHFRIQAGRQTTITARLTRRARTRLPRRRALAARLVIGHAAPARVTLVRARARPRPQ